MTDDPIGNGNGNGNGESPVVIPPGLPDRLTELELTKAKLGISTNARDAYLNILVQSVYAELAEVNGIRLSAAQRERLDVIDFVADGRIKLSRRPNARTSACNSNLYVKYAVMKMLPYDVTLITESITYDSIGQEIKTETETTIQADLSSVVRNEFYQAAQAGLKPEWVFLVNEFEYGGQKLVKFDGDRYAVIRAYHLERDGMAMVELTCERKLGV